MIYYLRKMYRAIIHEKINNTSYFSKSVCEIEDEKVIGIVKDKALFDSLFQNVNSSSMFKFIALSIYIAWH